MAVALVPYFERAERMLGSAPYPEDWPDPVKLAALAVAAEGVSATVERPRINVTFEAGVNAAGIHQEACTLCGDCVSGCNHNAKNTVLVNYLPGCRRPAPRSSARRRSVPSAPQPAGGLDRHLRHPR